MASTPGGNFALIDRLLDGQLAERLRTWRSETPAASYDVIAQRLAADDVAVSRETVGRWCRALELVDTSTGGEAA